MSAVYVQDLRPGDRFVDRGQTYVMTPRRTDGRMVAVWVTAERWTALFAPTEVVERAGGAL